MASSKLSVRLRPELKPAENFAAAETVQLASYQSLPGQGLGICTQGKGRV